MCSVTLQRQQKNLHAGKRPRCVQRCDGQVLHLIGRTPQKQHQGTTDYRIPAHGQGRLVGPQVADQFDLIDTQKGLSIDHPSPSPHDLIGVYRVPLDATAHLPGGTSLLEAGVSHDDLPTNHGRCSGLADQFALRLVQHAPDRLHLPGRVGRPGWAETAMSEQAVRPGGEASLVTLQIETSKEAACVGPGSIWLDARVPRPDPAACRTSSNALFGGREARRRSRRRTPPCPTALHAVLPWLERTVRTRN